MLDQPNTPCDRNTDKHAMILFDGRRNIRLRRNKISPLFDLDLEIVEYALIFHLVFCLPNISSSSGISVYSSTLSSCVEVEGLYLFRAKTKDPFITKHLLASLCGIGMHGKVATYQLIISSLM